MSGDSQRPFEPFKNFEIKGERSMVTKEDMDKYNALMMGYRSDKGAEDVAHKEEVMEGLRTELNWNASRILGIAEQVNNFVDEKGWSWADMEKVHRVLRVIREG